MIVSNVLLNSTKNTSSHTHSETCLLLVNFDLLNLLFKSADGKSFSVLNMFTSATTRINRLLFQRERRIEK